MLSMASGSAESPGIPQGDLHRLLSLLAEVLVFEGNLQRRQHHLLEGLAHLLQANRWTWTQQGLRKEEPPETPSESFACILPGGPGRGAQLIASRTMAQGSAAKVVFERLPEEGDFGEKETRLVTLTLEEVPWLFGDFSRECSLQREVPDLTPREDAVLALMKEGRSRKEVATALSLSEHTTSGYIKTLFRKLGVHSHSQLMGLALREQPFPKAKN